MDLLVSLLDLIDKDHVLRCPLCKWKIAVAPGAGLLISEDRCAVLERQAFDHLSQHTIHEWTAKLRTMQLTHSDTIATLVNTKTVPLNATDLLAAIIGMRESDRRRLWEQIEASDVICERCGHTKDHGTCSYCMGRYGK